MKKLAAVFLLVILAAVWTGGCSIAKKDTLTVGMELAYPLRLKTRTGALRSKC